jgi:hypothetical protein
MLNRFKDATGLINHVLHGIDVTTPHGRIFPGNVLNSSEASAVLLLLGRHPQKHEFEPCIILNKRSQNVKQPGDLCCPGGSITPRLDSFLSVLLALSVFPLGKWPCWSKWRHQRPRDARQLSLLLATSLRESFEEMRLNPLGVRFLGHLPSQRLVMFRRVIYPMVGWISRQKRFLTNREVEKVVYIPLAKLLDPGNYGRYRLEMNNSHGKKLSRIPGNFPCFHHENQDETELLWGATYRIVISFLQLVFGFKPPDMISLPVYDGVLDENYVNGVG